MSNANTSHDDRLCTFDNNEVVLVNFTSKIIQIKMILLVRQEITNSDERKNNLVHLTDTLAL